MKRLRDDHGQALVFIAITMAVILGLAGLTLDVGRKFREDRHIRGAVDAAALAGAWDLPDCPSQAVIDAQASFTTNSVTREGSPTATVPTPVSPFDTLSVSGRNNVSGMMSNLFGVSLFPSGADTTAKVFPVDGALAGVRPLVFLSNDPHLPPAPGDPGSCTTVTNPQTRTSSFNFIGVPNPGSFGLIDFSGTIAGDANTEKARLADWMQNGYPASCIGGTCPPTVSLGPPGYPIVTGLNIDNGSALCQAINALVAAQSDITVPVGDENNDGTLFIVRGWAVFHLTGSSHCGSAPASFSGVRFTLKRYLASAAAAPIKVSSVSCNPASPINVGPPGTTCTATVAGNCGAAASYAWSSSNPTVASVSGSGSTATVTGNAAGTATITVTATAGSGCTGTDSNSVAITVNSAPPPPSGIGTVTVSGPANGAVGGSGSYSFSISGSCTGYTQSWQVLSGPGSTQGSTTGSTVTVNYTGTGTVVVQVTVTQSSCSGSPATGSASTTVGASSGSWSVTVTGTTNPTGGDNDIYTASATTSNGSCHINPTGYVWSLSNPSMGTLVTQSNPATVQVLWDPNSSGPVTLTVKVTNQGGSCTPNPQTGSLNIGLKQLNSGDISGYFVTGGLSGPAPTSSTCRFDSIPRCYFGLKYIVIVH